MVGEPQRVVTRRSAATACCGDRLEAQRRLAGDRVVVLRQRESDAHRRHSTGVVSDRRRTLSRCSSACPTCRRDAIRRCSTRSPRRARRRCSTCTPTPTTTARCSRSRARRRPTPSRGPALALGGRRALDLGDATRACTHASACSTSSRSSRSTGDAATAAVDAAHEFASGRARRSACRCSSTATPTPARSLPDTRRDAFRERAPDFGPRRPHPARRSRGRRPAAPRRGQLRARRPTTSLLARTIAREIRERDGGPPGRAGARAPTRLDRGASQVSMNLIDLERDRAASARAQRCAPGRGRRRRTSRASSWSACCRPSELARCDPEFLGVGGSSGPATRSKPGSRRARAPG